MLFRMSGALCKWTCNGPSESPGFPLPYAFTKHIRPCVVHMYMWGFPTWELL